MATIEDLLAQCERIREKLARLDEFDPDGDIIGHDFANFELQPPLKEAEIIAFEAQHGIQLPLDYRTFLLHVGSSGTGPGSGLEPLGCFMHATYVAAGDVESPLELLPKDFLRAPFPHHDWWQPMQYPTLPPDATDKEYKAWEKQGEQVQQLRDECLYPIQFVTGTLTIAHMGCGIFDFLVVSGDERGNMWRDDRMNLEGLYPSSLAEPLTDANYEEYDHVTYEENRRLCFLDWYEGWLDNVLYFAENHLDELFQ